MIRWAGGSAPWRAAGLGYAGRGVGGPPTGFGGEMAFHKASVHARWRAPSGLCVEQKLRAASPMAASHSSRFSRGSESKLGSIVDDELELDMVGLWGVGGGLLGLGLWEQFEEL